MILKNPTWQSLLPDLPKFSLIKNSFSKQLLNTLEINGNVYAAYFSGKKTNNYLILSSCGSDKTFIKLIKNTEISSMLTAENIASWLKQQGLSVNTILPELSRPFDHQTYLLCYRYIEGRRTQPTLSDMMQLGRTLAHLHLSLKNYPQKIKFELATRNRLAKLNECRQQIAHGQLMRGPYPALLRSLAKRSELLFESSWHPATPLHGDMNPGNLLFCENDLFVLDFEDTSHSVFPAIYELSYLIERLILIQVPNDKSAIKLGCTLLDSYRTHGGIYEFHENDYFCLQMLALRALCILTLCEVSSILIVASEWQKFFDMLEVAKQRASVFKSIISIG